jgi:DnaJ-class molecular chaperone
MRDPYKTLGVKRDAGVAEIKAAWRNLAKAVHPDHNQSDPTATERFAEIGRAYETLKDPQKRSRYDQVIRMAEATNQSPEQTIIQKRQAAREAAERAKVARANAEKVMEELARANAQKAAKAAAANAAAQAAPNTAGSRANAGAQSSASAQPSAGGAPQSGATQAESPEDMIERIFGSATQASAPKNDAEATGAKHEDAAEEQASDSETPEDEYALSGGGIGSLITQPFGILSSLVRRITGAALTPVQEKAPEIAAEATVTINDILQGNWINVPLSDGKDVRFQAGAGMSNGHIVHLKGQGLKLQGMQRGDVAITVHLADDTRFRVNGFDIHTILPLTIENAVLGWHTQVEGPRGTVDVTVPAWSSSDHVIRMAGGGLPDGNGAKGDLVVELRLMLWEKPDDKVTDLMRSMKDGLFL